MRALTRVLTPPAARGWWVSKGERSASAIRADTDGRRRQGARRETTQHCFVRRQRYLNLDELLPGPNTGNTELRKLRHMDSGFTCAGQRCLPSAGQHLETRMSRHTPVDRTRTQACLSGFALSGFVHNMRAAQCSADALRCGAQLRSRREEHIHVTHTQDTDTTSSSVLTHAHPREMDVVNATGELVQRM